MFSGSFSWSNNARSSSFTQKKTVTVHINGDYENSKVVYIEPEWGIRDFLQAASFRLGLALVGEIVYNRNGAVIDDCLFIEDNDVLFISSGEKFIAPSTSIHAKASARSDAPSTIGPYKVRRLLGKGGFGEVRVGQHMVTNTLVALKLIRKQEISDIDALDRTNNEIQCLSTLHHPNIIALIEHIESADYLALAFELMEGGDLYGYLKKRGSTPHEQRLGSRDARLVFSQLVSAVSFAHSQHIIHRDLKLENILLKGNNLELVKVADFGLSAFYRPGSMQRIHCGTLTFLAPESFSDAANAGPPLDIWSLGVILFAMLCGRLPFDDIDYAGDEKKGKKRRSHSVIQAKIIKGHYRIDNDLLPEEKDIIRSFLTVDPANRMTLPEALNHPWMKMFLPELTPLSLPTGALTETGSASASPTASPAQTPSQSSFSSGLIGRIGAHDSSVLGLLETLEENNQENLDSGRAAEVPNAATGAHVDNLALEVTRKLAAMESKSSVSNDGSNKGVGGDSSTIVDSVDAALATDRDILTPMNVAVSSSTSQKSSGQSLGTAASEPTMTSGTTFRLQRLRKSATSDSVVTDGAGEEDELEDSMMDDFEFQENLKKTMETLFPSGASAATAVNGGGNSSSFGAVSPTVPSSNNSSFVIRKDKDNKNRRRSDVSRSVEDLHLHGKRAGGASPALTSNHSSFSNDGGKHGNASNHEFAALDSLRAEIVSSDSRKPRSLSASPVVSGSSNLYGGTSGHMSMPIKPEFVRQLSGSRVQSVNSSSHGIAGAANGIAANAGLAFTGMSIMGSNNNSSNGSSSSHGGGHTSGHSSGSNAPPPLHRSISRQGSSVGRSTSEPRTSVDDTSPLSPPKRLDRHSSKRNL